MDKSKGLQNYAGENNCFLNVGIQILWHLDAFRVRFFDQEKHDHREGCTFCALKCVFTQVSEHNQRYWMTSDNRCFTRITSMNMRKGTEFHRQHFATRSRWASKEKTGFKSDSWFVVFILVTYNKLLTALPLFSRFLSKGRCCGSTRGNTYLFA